MARGGGGGGGGAAGGWWRAGERQQAAGTCRGAKGARLALGTVRARVRRLRPRRPPPPRDATRAASDTLLTAHVDYI